MTADDIQDEVYERREAFEATLGHHGSIEDGMIRTVEKMYEITNIFFGEEIAERNFRRMTLEVLRRKDDPAENWRDVIEENSASLFFETEGGVLLFELSAYAEQGIVLSPARDARQRKAMLQRWIEDGNRLLKLLPLEQWSLGGEHLVRIIRMATARWKVDTGEPINAEELALLSGKALQTIRNKLANKPSEIGGSQNRIEAKDASRWLVRQKEFKPSIWQSQDDSDVSSDSPHLPEEFLFVPVATDGTNFHPGLARDDKYQVGGEGQEQEFAGFDEALSALQSMFVPQWRRPTPEGRWTRVRGIEWRRIPKDELSSKARPSAD